MHRRSFLRGILASTVAIRAAGRTPRSSAGKPADPLAEQVSIYRDDFGVPHILGETEEATFFGYGYAQAQDHLEKMMIHYLDAQGRLAEVQDSTHSARDISTSSPMSIAGMETTCNGCCARRKPSSRTKPGLTLRLTRF